MQRIRRERGLIRKQRRKYQRKQDLAALKAPWRLVQQISADNQGPRRYPYYWPQMKHCGLPTVQYSARAARSGLQFFAFASRRSAKARALFAQRIQRYRQRCGVDLWHMVWQTDNGREYIGELQPDGSRPGFLQAVTCFGSQHEHIPSAAHTY